MEIHRIEDIHSLLERAALQDRTAEMAAEVADEAERTGQVSAAKPMWELARRCRVLALKLRVLAWTGRSPGSTDALEHKKGSAVDPHEPP